MQAYTYIHVTTISKRFHEFLREQGGMYTSVQKEEMEGRNYVIIV